jgi:hypothetical protein
MLLFDHYLEKYNKHFICPSWTQTVNRETYWSSTNKTDSHDIAEILLKVALNTITLTLTLKLKTTSPSHLFGKKNIYNKYDR